MGRMSEERFDLFMSLAGPDRKAVRELVRALRAAGMTVFYDENLPEYHGITEEIESALAGSTALLAYYSTHYTSRTACQYELTAAFLSGQREGDPTRRIMVINPHEETDHLQPAELADLKFDRLPAPGDKATMSDVVGRVTARLSGLTGTIGRLPGPDRRRWYTDRTAGTPDFVGRYHDLWALHSALTAHRFGLTKYSSSGGTCVLTGLPGIGKSALAAAYAWHFEAAHRAGVWWVSLAGCGPDPDDVAAQLTIALRDRLRDARVDGFNGPVDEIPGIFAGHVARQSEPSLLVIDDIPGELNAALTHRLAVSSAGDRLRTVLISNRADLDTPARRIEIGPMEIDDAMEMLRGYRAGTDRETAALARRVGASPMALRLAGRILQGGPGLVDYAELTERIDRDAVTMAPVTALLHDRLDALDETARQLLRLAVVCSPAALPAVLVKRLLGASDAARAVEALHQELVVITGARSWQVHALVRDAARAHLPASDWTALAAQAADAVLGISGADRAEETLLVRHAAHLANRTDLPYDEIDALHRRVIEHFDGVGEAILALPHHRALADRHPDDPAILVAAARALHAIGAFEEARDRAASAARLAGNADLAHEAKRILAEALDASGSRIQAEPLWTSLMAEGGAAPADSTLAYLRSRRLRGQHQSARQGLAELIARLGDAPVTFHQAQAARLELARTEVETNAQVAARRRAADVIRAYAERGLAGHVNAIEATRLLADARLTLALTDLKADHDGWQNAAQELQQLRDRYADSHGPRNTLTLTLAVAYAEALTALGRPGDARRAIQAVRDDLAQRFEPVHPTVLRAEVVLGYAAAQCGRHQDAREHFARAYEGQRKVLGELHPHTLRSEFNLGVALKMTGDSAGARTHLTHMLRHAPGSVGIGTDLFWQGLFGSGLSLLPTRLWRKLGNSPKPPEDC